MEELEVLRFSGQEFPRTIERHELVLEVTLWSADGVVGVISIFER